MIKPLAQFLETATGFPLGSRLHVGAVPDTAPDLCSVIIEVSSPANPILMDTFESMIEVISRGKTYFTARADSQAIYSALHSKGQKTLPEIITGEKYQVNSTLFPSRPHHTGMDDKGRYLFSATYLLLMQRV